VRAETVIYTLLAGNAPLLALLGTSSAASVYPGVVSQTAVLPALAVEHIVTVDLGTIDAAHYALVQARIEVTVLAPSYESQKAVLEAVRVACQYQRGTIAGVPVNSVVRASVGPDLRSDDMKVYRQSIDFYVTHHET
jgi:hypothetical protein